MTPLTLLFVCTGNICRSPMAEGIMHEALMDCARTTSLPPIVIGSAGTATVDGMPASDHALVTARTNGIDIGAHRSRRLTQHLASSADVILTMTRTHTSNTLSLGYTGFVTELKQFGRYSSENDTPSDIPDPMGYGLDVYAETFLSIDKEIRRVLPLIFEMAKLPKSDRIPFLADRLR